MAVDRVKWFRDHAERDRWKEEKETLDEEFVRTEKSHAIMKETWSTLAQNHSDHAGARAYAYRQSEMYCKLAEDCRLWHT